MPTTDPKPTISTLHQFDKRFIVRAVLNFLIAFGVLLALECASFVIMHKQIEGESTTSSLLSVAGQQRMTSQRIPLLTFTALIAQSDPLREKTYEVILSELADMERAHSALMRGDSLRGIPAEKSAEVQEIFYGSQTQLDGKVEKFLGLARGLATSQAENLTVQNPRLVELTEVSNELLYLFQRLIAQYKREGAQGISNLQRLATGALVSMIVASFFIAIFIFYPLIRRLTIELDARRQVQQELIEHNRELEHFAGIVAHDLKAPLNNIGGFSKFLKVKLDSSYDEVASDLLEHIEQGVKRMGRMISDLLEFARVANKNDRFQKVSLNSVVEHVLKDFNLQIQATKAEVKVALLPEVLGDRGQLEHLFHNLLSNSLKYASPERAPRIVIISKDSKDPAFANELSDRAEWSTVVVEDNGRGFPQGAEQRMFEPFRRLSPTEGVEGAGLGLAICKKIIRRHHGKIRAENVPSGGARFFVSLPVS